MSFSRALPVHLLTACPLWFVLFSMPKAFLEKGARFDIHANVLLIGHDIAAREQRGDPRDFHCRISGVSRFFAVSYSDVEKTTAIQNARLLQPIGRHRNVRARANFEPKTPPQNITSKLFLTFTWNLHLEPPPPVLVPIVSPPSCAVPFAPASSCLLSSFPPCAQYSLFLLLILCRLVVL